MFTGPLRVASPAKADADRARVLSLVPFAKHLMGKLLQVHKHNDFRHLQKEMITPSGDIIRVTAIRPYIFNAFIVPFGMLVQEDPRIRRILGGFLLRPNEEEVAYRSPDLFFDPAPEEQSLVNLEKVSQYHNNLTLGVVGEHYACGVNDPPGGGFFYNAAVSQFGKIAHVNDAIADVEADTIGLWVTDIGDVVKVRQDRTAPGELVLTFHSLDNPFTEPKQTLTIPESRFSVAKQWFVPSENGRVATAIWRKSGNETLVTLEITHSDGEWSIIRYESPIVREETPTLLYEDSADTFAMVVNTHTVAEGRHTFSFMGHWTLRTATTQYVCAGGVSSESPFPIQGVSSVDGTFTGPPVNFRSQGVTGEAGEQIFTGLPPLYEAEELDPGFIARCDAIKGTWGALALPTIICDGRTVITTEEWYEGTGIDGVGPVQYQPRDENGDIMFHFTILIVHFEPGSHSIAHGIPGSSEFGELIEDTVGTASGGTYRHSSTRLDREYPIAPAFGDGLWFRVESSSVFFSTQNFCGDPPPHFYESVPDTEGVYLADQLVCDIYDRDTRYREHEGLGDKPVKWDYASAVYPLHINPSGLVRLSSAEMPSVSPETVRTVWVMAELYWEGEWTTLWEHEGTYERFFAFGVRDFADEPFTSVARNWDDRYLVVIRLPDPEATIAANEGKEWFDQEDWVWKEHFFIADGEGAILKTQESIIADVGSDEITPVRTLTGSN